MSNPVTSATCTAVSNGFFLTWKNPTNVSPLPTFYISVSANVTVGGVTTYGPDNYILWGTAVADREQYGALVLDKGGANYIIKIRSTQSGVDSPTTVNLSLAPLSDGSTASTTELSIASTTLAKTVPFGTTQTFSLTIDCENISSTDDTYAQVGTFANDLGNSVIQNTLENLQTTFFPGSTFVQGVQAVSTNVDGTQDFNENITIFIKLGNVLSAGQIANLNNNTYYLGVAKILNSNGSFQQVDNFYDLNPLIVNGPLMNFQIKSGSPYIIFYGPMDQPPCFPPGVRILTSKGYKNVENIKTNEDKIITSDGRIVPCIVVSKHIKKTTKLSAPYKIEANAFGPKSPPNDIILSPKHAIQSSKDVWQIPEIVAKNNPKIYQINIGEPITYYHIECPNYFTDNLVVEDAVVESFGWYQVSNQNVFEYDESIGGLRRNPTKQIKYAVFDEIESQKALNIKLAF